MKEIAVTGGKGGVGKSTVAVLLAGQIAKKEKIILVDADVECPNDYLLTNQKLDSLASQVGAYFPKLIESKCQKCGLCRQKCRFNAIFGPPGNTPEFYNDLCANCGLCWHVCPFGAITKIKKVIGEIFESRINDNLLLITGRSGYGVDETGPIVQDLRKYARKRAKELDVETIIIDTAPGAHCSVINALLEVNQAIAVTEPTPLGQHDLRVIIEVIKKLGIDYKVVINQADLGDINLIKNNFDPDKIIAEVPYCQKITDGYARGNLLKLKSHRLEKCLVKS
jgi:MinD superfamily P-loop ATPase